MLRHQLRPGPEVCEGIANDEMSVGDVDEWFKQENHKLFCPQRLVSLDLRGL